MRTVARVLRLVTVLPMLRWLSRSPLIFCWARTILSSRGAEGFSAVALRMNCCRRASPSFSVAGGGGGLAADSLGWGSEGSGGAGPAPPPAAALFLPSLSMRVSRKQVKSADTFPASVGSGGGGGGVGCCWREPNDRIWRVPRAGGGVAAAAEDDEPGTGSRKLLVGSMSKTGSSLPSALGLVERVPRWLFTLSS